MFTDKHGQKGVLPKPVDANQFSWKIPVCCLENWDNCPHKIKRQKKAKRNIAL